MEVRCPRCGKVDTVHPAAGEGYECTLCRVSFGGVPSFDKSIVRSISFSINPVFVKAWTVSIKEKADGAYLDSRYGSDRRKGYITRERWEAFISRLQEEAYIDAWKPMYFSANEMKGAIWELSIKLRYKHLISCKGIGCLPPYWEEFVGIIRELIKETDSGV